MHVAGVSLIYLLLAVTIASCFVNEKLLSKFITSFGRELASTTDICLINATAVADNLIQYLSEKGLTVVSFVYSSSKLTSHQLLKCTVYLLYEVLHDFNAAIQHLEELLLSELWNPSGLFIFFCESSCDEQTSKIYSRVTQRYGLQRSLLQMNSHLVFCDIFAKRITIYNASDSYYLQRLLPTSPLMNAHGYELRVEESNNLFPYCMKATRYIGSPVGPFVQVLQALSITSNVTIRWLRKPISTLDNSTVEQSNQVNVVFFKSIRSPYTVQLASCDQDAKCLFLDERPIENHFLVRLRPFSDMAWLTIPIVAVMAIAFSCFLPTIFPRNLLLMTLSGPPLPCRRMTRYEQTVLLMLNLLLVILSSAYLTNLLQIIYSHKYERHIRTMREFEQSGIQVYSPNADERRRVNNAYPSWRVVGSDANMKAPTKSAMTTRCAIVQMLIKPPSTKTKPDLRQLYVIREPLYWDAIVHSFAKTNPLVERFEQVWTRMYETGIVGMFTRFVLKERLVRRKPFDGSLLQFGDLLSMWWILAYGYGGSAIVFLGEFMWNDMCRMGFRLRLKDVILRKRNINAGLP